MEVPHAGDATGEEVMEVMYPRCAGLDVHKETVVACVRIVEGGDVSRSVRTFATTTASLIELGEWLEVNGCTHVAMEATGVYWKPVWQVLADGAFELILANAAQVKSVPGRKTDVNDAWLPLAAAHTPTNPWRTGQNSRPAGHLRKSAASA
jgi:transposase